MAFATPTRCNVTAAVLALALGLAGSLTASARVHHPSKHPTRAAHQPARHAIVHHSSSHRTRHHRGSVHRRTASLGQRTMDSQRAMEIQQALIQAHYLTGSPTGEWDPATQAAMVKYQADNGWQAKIAPDSRALIKLGLGPKQDEGEYSANPTGISALTQPAPMDTIRSMATSEMPATTEN
jgi:hypothetical protein